MTHEEDVERDPIQQWKVASDAVSAAIAALDLPARDRRVKAEMLQDYAYILRTQAVALDGPSADAVAWVAEGMESDVFGQIEAGS